MHLLLDHSTPATLHTADMKAFWWETYRKHLVDTGQFPKAKKTYSAQKTFLADQNTATFWDQKFQETDTDHAMEIWRIQKVLKEIKNQPTQITFLNLGVGRGFFEKHLFQAVPNLRYTGTDITTDTFAELTKRFPDRTFIKTPLTKLPFGDNSFDQITLLEVLEHIKPNETFQVLSEVFRVLRPGGQFIVSVPMNEDLHLLLPENPNSHMRFYSERLLTFELRTAGFIINKTYLASAFHRWFWLKHWVNRVLWLRRPNNIIAVCQKPSSI